jgi:nucleoside 2-deoxyribosyltransferase
MKIYMASPLGFAEAGRDFYYREMIPLIKKLGHEPLDPWQSTAQVKVDEIAKMPPGAEKLAAWRKLNFEIGESNAKAIDACDAVLAVLDGVDVDSGTAGEIGYAFARGKPIVGYRGDFRISADNEGATVNLQVEYFILKSGGQIVTRIAEIPAALARIARK